MKRIYHSFAYITPPRAGWFYIPRIFLLRPMFFHSFPQQLRSKKDAMQHTGRITNEKKCNN